MLCRYLILLQRLGEFVETFWKFIIEGDPFSENVIRSFFITFKVSPRDVSKSQFDTLNSSLEELAVLKTVGENPPHDVL